MKPDEDPRAHDDAETPEAVSKERPLPHELWLGNALKTRMEDEGGFAGLARAITESVPREERVFSRQKPTRRKQRAGDTDAPVLIDRRRLMAIAKASPNVVLSLRELSYLDRYLAPFGKGLAYNPIFQGSNLLEVLAQTEHVDVLLGTKPEQERQNISHWDVLGLAEIQRGMQDLRLQVRIDIHDVPLCSTTEGTRESLEAEALSSLLREDGNSLVVIGSSRSNPAADAVLCRMLGRPPFSGAPNDKRGLPFHFVWAEGLLYVHESALHLGPDDIREIDPHAADLIAARKYSALAVGETVYIDTLSHWERSWGDTVGICAVQRRSNGKLWVVVSGVTGVATYVAAKHLRELSTRLHEPHTGRNSPVYWCVVRVSVPEDGTGLLTSRRRFPGSHILPQPEIAAASER